MLRTLASLVFTGAALNFLFIAQAQAQATRTWVSGAGDDANPCSRTAPCKTFAGAISKTARNGEINCIDPGGFGALTITKSITIDCREEFGSILYSGTNGINVAFDSFAADDARKTVRLRNLNLNGADTGVNGIRISGGAVRTAGAVLIEDCLIDGNFAGASRGISDERSAGGELYISNTTVRNVGSFGIVISPSNGTAAGQRIDSTLDNVRVQNTNHGAVFGSNVRVMVNRSVFSGNAAAGVLAGTTFGAVEVNISNSAISNNGLGVANDQGSVTIRLAANDIAFNTTGLSGATQSYGNNRIDGNGSLGTAPTAIPSR
jgi:hypothetical protein